MKKSKKDETVILEDDEFVVHNKKSNKSKKILDELDELELEPAKIISKNRPKKEKKEKEEYEKLEEQTSSDNNGDDWIATISSFKTEKIKKGKRRKTSIFDYYEKSTGEKKKNKKKKDEMTDYTKEFENESRLLKNLLLDQSKFVDSLQKKYDAMESTKSASRGVGKFTSDLMVSINSGRSLSMQLIEKLIGVKKTVADLTMKEKKELASKVDGSTDMNMYSANFLKQMLNEGRSNIIGSDYDTTVEDSDPESLFDVINDELGEDMRSNEESDTYLKYENMDVTIYLIEDTVNNDMWFEARDKNGDVVGDYPLPKLEGININRSTNVASDKYSRKYPVEYI